MTKKYGVLIPILFVIQFLTFLVVVFTLDTVNKHINGISENKQIEMENELK